MKEKRKKFPWEITKKEAEIKEIERLRSKNFEREQKKREEISKESLDDRVFWWSKL